MKSGEPLLLFFVLRCNYIPLGGIVNEKSTNGLTFPLNALLEVPSVRTVRLGCWRHSPYGTGTALHAGSQRPLTRPANLRSADASLPTPHPTPLPRLPARGIRQDYRRQRPKSGASLMPALPPTLDSPQHRPTWQEASRARWRHPTNTSMKNLHNRLLTIVYKTPSCNQAEYNKEIGF